jgi:1,2-diacylglycerol-3-alpha-glucose alpha-1,2-glucosyltransferase
MTKMTTALKAIIQRMMNSKDKKLKVLLCLNGDKDPNKAVMDRGGVLLRYALEAAGIEYTYDYREYFDVVHLLSLNQYYAYKNVSAKKIINKNAKVVLSLFNDSYDAKVEEDSSDEMDYRQALAKAFKGVEADEIICPWLSQGLILKHYDLFKSVNVVNIGSKAYDSSLFSDIEKEAFRRYYRLQPEDHIVVSYGEYDYARGIGDLEAVARILPDFEFFFFGSRAGLLSGPARFEKNNDIANLHYVGNMPEELYHSALLSADCLFLPYKNHIDSVYVLEAMKAKVPVVAAANQFLFDLLIDKKTAMLGTTVEEYFNLLKEINSSNCAKSAYEFASAFTPETYGKRLKEIYSRLIAAKA